MDLEFFTDLLILGFAAICIHYLIRSKKDTADFIVNLLMLVPLTLITIRNIEFAVPMLIMIVVWEIKSLRKDSDRYAKHR